MAPEGGQRANSTSSLRHSLIRWSASADRSFAGCVDNTHSHAAESGNKEEDNVTLARRDGRKHRAEFCYLPARKDPIPEQALHHFSVGKAPGAMASVVSSLARTAALMFFTSVVIIVHRGAC